MNHKEDADLQALIMLGLVEAISGADGSTEYRLSEALASPDYAPNAALVARCKRSAGSEKGTRT